MPVRTRAKAAQYKAAQSGLPPLAELETTPTSPHQVEAKHSLISGSHGQDAAAPATWNGQSTADGNLVGHRREGNGHSGREKHPDGDRDAKAAASRAPSFRWSETESVARRSSPLLSGETPKISWDFESGNESMAPFSSPTSGQDKLPDTAPLPVNLDVEISKGELSGPCKQVDFSETASTLRRSTPVGTSVSPDEELPTLAQHKYSLGDGQEASHDSLSAARDTATHEGYQVALDDIFDVTPSPSSTRPSRKLEDGKGEGFCKPVHERPTNSACIDIDSGNAPTETQKGPMRTLASSDKRLEQASSRYDRKSIAANKACRKTFNPALTKSPAMGKLTWEEGCEKNAVSKVQKERKRKQRPKAPLQFDEVSSQFKEPSGLVRKSPPKGRMPIVSALRDSVQPSSSPATLPQKRSARNAFQPRKKARVKAPTANPVAAEEEVANAGGGSEMTNSEHQGRDISIKTTKRGGQAGANLKGTPPGCRPKPLAPPSTAEAELIILSSDGDSHDSDRERLPTQLAECRQWTVAQTEKQPSQEGGGKFKYSPEEGRRDWVSGQGMRPAGSAANPEEGLNMDGGHAKTMAPRGAASKQQSSQYLGKTRPKARLTERKFSVSEQGSPVPLQRQPTRVGESGFERVGVEQAAKPAGWVAQQCSYAGVKRQRMVSDEGQARWKLAEVERGGEKVHGRILTSLREPGSFRQSMMGREPGARQEGEAGQGAEGSLSQRLQDVVNVSGDMNSLTK